MRQAFAAVPNREGAGVGIKRSARERFGPAGSMLRLYAIRHVQNSACEHAVAVRADKFKKLARCPAGALKGCADLSWRRGVLKSVTHTPSIVVRDHRSEFVERHLTVPDGADEIAGFRADGEKLVLRVPAP